MTVRDARLLKQLINKAKTDIKEMNFGDLVEYFPGKSEEFLKAYYSSMNAYLK